MAIGGSGVSITITADRASAVGVDGVTTSPITKPSGVASVRRVAAPSFTSGIGDVGSVDVTGRASVGVSGISAASSLVGAVAVDVQELDATPPTVSLVTESGTVSEAGEFTLTATASDNVGVVRVDFFRDATFVGAATVEPFAINDTLAVTNNGNRVYTAVAYDAAGNSATSDPAVVVVSIVVEDTTCCNAGHRFVDCYFCYAIHSVSDGDGQCRRRTCRVLPQQCSAAH
jgi:chitinase